VCFGRDSDPFLGLGGWRFAPSFLGLHPGIVPNQGPELRDNTGVSLPGASSAKHILRVPHAPLESRNHTFSKSKSYTTSVHTYGTLPPSNSLIQSFTTFSPNNAFSTKCTGPDC
jgi:hypothetical protein